MSEPRDSSRPAAIPPAVLDNEEAIVWLEDPTSYRYVREWIIRTTYRQRRPFRKDCPGRMLGYATLKKSCPPAGRARFQRRCWFLYSHDPYPGEYGHPAEAVDPLSIRVGQPSDDPREPAISTRSTSAAA